MVEFAEVWKSWYETYLQELVFNRKKPTLYPSSDFDPWEDAVTLKTSMKGLGTNEEGIITILTTRTRDQRIQIQEKYGEMYGDLVEDLKSELSGVFEKVILSLLKPLPLFFAEQIKLATEGPGTDETALIGIFCTRDDTLIISIKQSFENKYEKSIEEIVCKETSGAFEKTLVSLLSLCRDDTKFSPLQVVDELCNEEVDEDYIRKILASFSFIFLRRVFKLSIEKTGHDFMELVEKKCSGDSKSAFKAIYLSSKCLQEFFALALHDAMKGLGTDDWALIRIIVSRCEIDLGTIKEKYTEVFGKDLIEEMKSDTSRDYEKALLNLLGDSSK